MSEKEKPLPKPPAAPFGRKKRFGEDESGEPLMVDRIAMAMAEGKLDEFIGKEMPEGDHARALTMMMMGMTGMMPPGNAPAAPREEKGKAKPSEEAGGAAAEHEQTQGIQPPEDIVMAIHAADVDGLKGLLEREYRKLNPDAAQQKPEEQARTERSDVPAGGSAQEKELIDQLLKMAEENSVSLDWLILRALRLYIREYRKNGRL